MQREIKRDYQFYFSNNIYYHFLILTLLPSQLLFETFIKYDFYKIKQIQTDLKRVKHKFKTIHKNAEKLKKRQIKHL